MTTKIHQDSGKTYAEGKWNAGKPMPACTSADDFGYSHVTPDRARVTCRACLALIHRQDIADRPADAPALELVKYEGPSAYRFSYEAKLAGVRVGFVVFDGAYRRSSWRICSNNLPADDERPDRLIGYELDRDPSKANSMPLAYPTKEAALLAIPELAAADRLPTYLQLIERRGEYKRREEEYRARQAQKDQARDEETALCVEGLTALLAGSSLSNAERAAVVIALRRITGKDEA